MAINVNYIRRKDDCFSADLKTILKNSVSTNREITGNIITIPGKRKLRGLVKEEFELEFEFYGPVNTVKVSEPTYTFLDRFNPLSS